MFYIEIGATTIGGHKNKCLDTKSHSISTLIDYYDSFSITYKLYYFYWFVK